MVAPRQGPRPPYLGVCDSNVVQKLAGHAPGAETIARHDRRGEAAKQQAADLLHVPYASRRRRRQVEVSSSP